MIRLVMPLAWLAGFIVGYGKAVLRDRNVVFWVAFTLDFYVGLSR